MEPKTNEYIAEQVAINLDGRTVTSHEHFREIVKKEVLYVLAAKDKEREEAWQTGFDRGVEAQMEVGGKEQEEAVAEARREVYEAIMSLPAWYIDDAEGHFRDKVLSLVTPPNTK